MVKGPKGPGLQEPRVVEGAEEFQLGEGPVGVLLVHGFTGSPQGLRGLGHYLSDRGLAVVGIRLPGHGTTWKDCNTKTSEDWVAAVDRGFELISEDHDEVFLVGLSFGAALILDLAARRPGEVGGVVCLATFLQTRDPRSHLAPIIKRVTKSVAGVGNDIADPYGREIVYARFPTIAGASMLSFGKSVRARLSEVSAPALIMHGRNDHTARPFNAQLVYEGISSTDKQLIWCERSFHVITLDYDRELVFDKTFQFINEHSHSLR
jgi:carboxylesterase